MFEEVFDIFVYMYNHELRYLIFPSVSFFFDFIKLTEGSQEQSVLCFCPPHFYSISLKMTVKPLTDSLRLSLFLTNMVTLMALPAA